MMVQASGKRRTAIARATLQEGSGRVRINRVPVELYQPELARMKIIEVLELSGKVKDRVDIDVKVGGGGFIGQIDAVRTAIGRVLVDYSQDMKLKEALMHYDRTILKGDSRRKESKKYGGPGARAKVQKSYR